MEQIVTIDAGRVGPDRDPLRLRRYLEVCAVNTARVIGKTTVLDAAGVSRKTADAYDATLTSIGLLDIVPAWEANLIKRLTRTPKRLLTDTGLASAILRVDEIAVRSDGDLLGRLLETFVAQQLRAELERLHDHRGEPIGGRLFHLRAQDGRREIDFIVERDDRTVVAIEVKATSVATRGDARHLTWLRDELGDRFAGGVVLVLHTGITTARLEDRVIAAPIASLWQGFAGSANRQKRYAPTSSPSPNPSTGTADPRNQRTSPASMRMTVPWPSSMAQRLGRTVTVGHQPTSLVPRAPAPPPEPHLGLSHPGLTQLVEGRVHTGVRRPPI